MRLAQLDRAFGYGPKGRGFESSNARAHFTLEELDTFSSSIFMHTDAERKYAAKAARVRRASRGRWLFPTRLRRPVQRKYAASAASRESLPYSIAHGRPEVMYQ